MTSRSPRKGCEPRWRHSIHDSSRSSTPINSRILPERFFGAWVSSTWISKTRRRSPPDWQKPLSRGGLLSAAYNPSPGYLFRARFDKSSGFNPRYVSELEIALRQPLLRNAGLQVNIAPIQVAQLAVDQSAWDFKRSLIDSVRSVAEAYWDLYAAQVAVDEYERRDFGARRDRSNSRGIVEGELGDCCRCGQGTSPA